MRPAITVEKVSKRYHIGQTMSSATTVRDALSGLLTRPLSGRLARKSTDVLWALRDVSFNVEQGEIIGIVGRNGAGKSTLLKILSRITRPTDGRIDLYGRVGSLLEVGTGFNPELTGRENIYLNGAILGMRRREIAAKFDEIVDFAEVREFIDTPVKHYSSGMYMRLAFGVAAHLDPEILVVDEVLAVGDYSFQKKCIGKMSNVAHEGRTILFVSHNLVALRSLCRRVIWLERGQLVMTGETNEVINSYIQKDVHSSHQKAWVRPDAATGNEEVTLCAVSLTSPGGEPLDRITVEDSIRLNFEYINHVPNNLLQVSFVLYNQEGICIFNSRSKPTKLPVGTVRQCCTIPGNLLNDDSYTVRVVIVKDTNVGIFDESNVLTFEVHDTERQGGWFGKWIGVTRPVLEWEEMSDFGRR
ncbi:MAG: ABC transporter ATP-binding protein [Acidobacteria bacterium]|nr:ABC transporter ATP-binding protein [Acidobacteriota bacterium]